MILASGATLDPIQLLLTQTGITGIFFVLGLLGWIWLKPSVDREFKKADETIKTQQALIDALLADQKAVLPLLTEVDKQLVPLMGATQSMMKRVETLLDRVEREWEWRERRTRVSEEPAPHGRSRRDLEDGG